MAPGDAFQRWVGEVEMEVALAHKVSKLATHDCENRFCRCVVSYWEEFHLWMDVGIVYVERSLAVPIRRKHRGLGIRHLANAVVEDDERPPQSSAHLSFKSVGVGIC